MKKLPRRTFLRNSALAVFGVGSLPETLTFLQRGRAIGANDRIRIGVIGCGERGRNAHLPGVYAHTKEINLEIVAVCDPWRIAREQANAKVKEWYGRDARQFSSYRDLLAMKEIDAVTIASPDHVHTLHLEAAAKAGKHIYVEKPMAMEMDKLVRAVDAVKASGTVVQVGTQVRSFPGIVGAREFYKSGALGKLSRIEECRNTERPYWYGYLKDVKKEDVDWAEFISDRKMRPFSAELYSGWYGYADFTHGPMSGYGAHFIDLVHYITGATFPESCVCLGGTYTWNDEHRFTAPDCVQATWIYPEGFLVSSSNNLGHSMGSVRNFYGDRGMINAGNWTAPTFTENGAPRRTGNIKGENKIPPVERAEHFLDWLRCIRNGGTPHAPIEAGYSHSVACLMAQKSYETGRKAIYDNKKRIITTV